MPVILGLCTFLYFLLVGDFDLTNFQKLLAVLGMSVLGFFLPKMFISNLIVKRQEAIRASFADTLDLLLICVESGMSIEVALRRVSREIGIRSIELAEELALTTAELSYLENRRQAYDNLARRTGLDMIKSFSTTLTQSEKYGTPLSQALHTLARENRQQQVHRAEKKAAGLGPKLTVPMILFFLPALFVVILAPAVLTVMEKFSESN